MRKSRKLSPVSLLDEIYAIYKEWNKPKHIWFRGEPGEAEAPLMPKLYRHAGYRENYLLQEFRRKAPSLIQTNPPATDETDKWLFLAQHYCLPTRLLDWTDNFFAATGFALEYDSPVIYVIDPIALNRLSAELPNDYEFPLTWHGENSIGTVNIRAAWEPNQPGTEHPIAIKPTYSDLRQSLQSSCFTIFGSGDRSMLDINGFDRIAEIRLPGKTSKSYGDIYWFFKRIGFRRTSQFGDLDSLASDITQESLSFGA